MTVSPRTSQRPQSLYKLAQLIIVTVLVSVAELVSVQDSPFRFRGEDNDPHMLFVLRRGRVVFLSLAFSNQGSAAVLICYDFGIPQNAFRILYL